MLDLELERRAVVDVVPDVLLVGQDLVNRAARPERAGIRPDALAVQDRRDDALGNAFLQNQPVDPEHHGDLFRWAGNQHNTVGLDALLLATQQ